MVSSFLVAGTAASNCNLGIVKPDAFNGDKHDLARMNGHLMSLFFMFANLTP